MDIKDGYYIAVVLACTVVSSLSLLSAGFFSFTFWIGTFYLDISHSSIFFYLHGDILLFYCIMFFSNNTSTRDVCNCQDLFSSIMMICPSVSIVPWHCHCYKYQWMQILQWLTDGTCLIFKYLWNITVLQAS